MSDLDPDLQELMKIQKGNDGEVLHSLMHVSAKLVQILRDADRSAGSLNRKLFWLNVVITIAAAVQALSIILKWHN